MKHGFLLFLAAFTFISSFIQGEQLKESTLSGFREFEIISFIPSKEFNQSIINESIVESFKKLGQVTVFESDSALDGLIQSPLNEHYPICILSIDEHEISMNVIAEIEVIANKQRTACPIWKEKLYVSTRDKNHQVDYSAIISASQEMISKFSIECIKSNKSDSKPFSFHIRKHKKL